MKLTAKDKDGICKMEGVLLVSCWLQNGGQVGTRPCGCDSVAPVLQSVGMQMAAEEAGAFHQKLWSRAVLLIPDCIR